MVIFHSYVSLPEGSLFVGLNMFIMFAATPRFARGKGPHILWHAQIPAQGLSLLLSKTTNTKTLKPKTLNPKFKP